MRGTTIEDRLSLNWFPTFCPDFPFEVWATEQLSSKRAATVKYLIVEEPAPEPGVRAFLVAKSQGQDVPRADEVYSVQLGPRGDRCTCRGSACRGHAAPCRHRLAAAFLAEQGVL